MSRLFARTVRWPHARQLATFLPLADLVWLRDGEGLIGFGEVTRFTTTGPGRFAAAESWWQGLMHDGDASIPDRLTSVPGTGLVAFSSLTFSKRSAVDSLLVVPEVVLGSHEGDSWVTVMSASSMPSDDEVLARLREIVAATDSGEPSGSGIERTRQMQVTEGALTEARWMDAVTRGVERIREGEVSKLVLARDVLVTSETPVAAGEIVSNLARDYEGCWTYKVGSLVGATPELLIRSVDSIASARVLAGTLDRRNAPADPDYALNQLAGSQKQLHEHQIAIDSLLAHLRPFTENLTVSEPFILELPNVWHLASDVQASLRGDGEHAPSCLSLLGAVHPTAAVCGTPTEVAGALIAEIEGMERGPFAGPVGWIDARGNGEFGIALRGGVVESGNSVRLYAGCGIVAGSDPEQELQETWAKFRPMLQALKVATR